MAFGQDWDEDTPTNSSNANEIDNFFRNLKEAIRERLAEEHAFYEDETGHSDVGHHKQGTAKLDFGLNADRPAVDADNPGLIYVETDTKTIWYDNGTAWVEITSSLYAQDDEKQYFGTDGDFSVYYDSGTNKLVFYDEVHSNICFFVLGYGHVGVPDNSKMYFGTGKDFAIHYQSLNDRLVIEDEINNVECLYVAKNGAITGSNITANDSDKLDGVQLANITWSDVNMQREEVISGFALSLLLAQDTTNIDAESYTEYPLITQQFVWHSSLVNSGQSIYLESVSNVDNSLATGYIRLYDVTDSAAVTDSEITFDNYTAVDANISSAITLTDGHIYRVEAKVNDSAYVIELYGLALIARD